MTTDRVEEEILIKEVVSAKGAAMMTEAAEGLTDQCTRLSVVNAEETAKYRLNQTVVSLFSAMTAFKTIRVLTITDQKADLQNGQVLVITTNKVAETTSNISISNSLKH